MSALKLISLIFLLISAWPAAPASAATDSISVMGSVSSLGGLTPNLTLTGTSDWIDWAAGVKSSSSSGQISNYSTVGGGSASVYQYGLSVSWSNGTPTASATNNSNDFVVYPIVNTAQGFSFSVPADTTVRTLYFYGVVNSTTPGVLTATFSNSTSAAYTDSSYTAGDVMYVITYSASSPGQSLTISWTTTGAAGQYNGIQLSSAALANGPGPLSITTTSLPPATQYQTYLAPALTAFGGTPPYTWSVTTGGSTLPEGMVLDPNSGIICTAPAGTQTCPQNGSPVSGQVGGQGGYQFAVQVQDSSNPPLTSTSSLIISVTADNTLGGCSIFPTDSIFHQRVDSLPVDTSPAAPIPAAYQTATIKPFFGSDAGPDGIPFIRVPYNQTPVNIQWLLYGGDSDPQTDSPTNPNSTTYPGVIPQYPFPANAPVEGTANSVLNGGDGHVIALQTAGGGKSCQLYEVWQGTYANITSNGTPFVWTASNGAHWDLSSDALRPLGETSGDAAGLPIMPLTVNYDEVASGTVTHPIRFTMNHMLNAIVWPGRHAAGVGYCTNADGTTTYQNSLLSQSNPPVSCTTSGPSGEIYRLKANVDTSVCNSDPQSLVILKAMKQYGIILADNGLTGGLIGTPDARWNNNDLSCLRNFTLAQFEPVNVSSLQVSPDSGATVSSSSGPTVSLSADQPSYTAPASIVLTATAAEANGTITQVVFNSTSCPNNICGTVSGNPYTITMNNIPIGTYTFTATATDAKNTSTTSSPITVIVNPPAVTTYTLNVSASNGTVAQSISGVASSGPYNSGTAVTLTATPASGYQFSSWSGDVSGTTNPTIVTMNANENVTANFTLISTVTYTLGISASNGTVAQSVNGTTSSGPYNSGTVVTLTAIPASGYQFSSWNGDVTGTNNPATVTMSTNENVTANFTPIPAGTPSTPINLATTAVSDTEINLTWDRVESMTTSLDETSITVWRSGNGGAYAKLAVLPAGSNIFTDTSCYPSTQYSYQVTADKASVSSVPSAAVSATTQASAATLTQMAAVTASTVSPFTINLTWPSTGTSSYWFIERSSNGVSYAIVGELYDDPAASSLNYSDTLLSPSTTYSYRMRLVSGGAYGNYSNPVSATTQARLSGTPLEPTGLTATVNSATSTTLNWTDTNNNAASYLIETAPASWTTPTWTQIAQTTAGATSYALPTTAQTFYYVRVRGSNSSGDSGYTPTVVFRTASPGTGSTKTYKIGPGQPYTSLGALNWSQLGPGDTVDIYPNKDANGNIIPYYEKPLINVRGTAAAPITITGVPDPATGALPIIDGTNAVTNSQWLVSYLPLEDDSLILIGSSGSSFWSPGYFTLSNLEIRNGYDCSNDTCTTNSYTAGDGSIRKYTTPSGIYITDGDHITLKGLYVHGNNEGIFAAGQGDQRNLEEITLDSNTIEGNGTINNYSYHNSYIEGINDVYQFNKYGPLRAGSLGGGLKDRGANTVIRYNYFNDAGGHDIDLVETQNYSNVVITMPSYHQTYVYGNIFYNSIPGGATTPIHYGGDSLPSPYYRKGTLHFYNNTYDNEGNGWNFNLFYMATGGESVDARNNIIYVNAPSQMPVDYLLTSNGVGYFGRNWVSSGWQVSNTYFTFTGHIAGTGNFVNNAQNDPGFFDAPQNDYQLVSTSQGIDLGVLLSTDEPPVLTQYIDPASNTPSVSINSANDLGAYQQIESSSQTPVIYTLGITTANGTVVQSVNGSPSTGPYNSGTVVTLTATPASGYQFSSWSGAVSGTNNTATVTMSANENVTANFIPITYAITASAGTGGVISPSGTVSVNDGGSQKFTVTANNGYLISNVLVDGAAVTLAADNSYTLTNVLAAHTITVSFSLNSYAITASAGTGGVISPVGVVNVNYGTNQTFTVTPSSGYSINSVLADGSPVTLAADNSYTFTNVTTAHNISATFSLIPPVTYTLGVVASNGSVAQSVNGVASSGPYNSGTVVTLTATPANGYQFSSWSGAVAGTSNPATVTMSANENVTANFTLIPPVTYTLGVTALNGTVAQSVNGVASSGPYNSGTVVTLTATPASGYQFSSWSGAVSGTNNTATVTMSANENVTANFTLIPAVPSSKPQAPKDLTATVSAGQVGLSWQPSTGADSYIVQRLSDWNIGYATIATGITVPEYTDNASLINGNTYYYEVIAVNAKGNSYASNQVDAVASSTGNYTFPVYVYGSGKVQCSYISNGQKTTQNITSGSTITVPAGTQVTLTNDPASRYTFNRYYIPNVGYSTKKTVTFTVNSDYYADVYFQQSK